ncbi:hypothetical protein EHM69_04240 [candidate division KSB1 bacterium]|nr:MAG: hypothetical protein EHM69_04240 [candidate division KSB1 bacterium]
MFPFSKHSRQRPLIPPRVVAKRSAGSSVTGAGGGARETRRQTVSGNLFTTTLDGQDFVWMGTNRAEFYRYLRDHVPIISAAIWSWVHLCATQQSYNLKGSEAEKNQAVKILRDLETRLLENPLIRRDGLKHLTEQFFLELFTTGSFAGEIVPLADGTGIDYFRTMDPDLIQWERDGRWRAYILDPADEFRAPGKPEKRIYLTPERFFFATLGADITNPGGIEPMASIPFVAQIQEAMLSDMARSARNAGTPRLQIRVTPPKAFAHENEKEYQARINRYFDDTVSQFSRLDADDNLFTWNDVEVTLIGGDMNRNFTWRLNREQVIEDVITGLRLFPWVLGRSHGTTKNWVEAQFNMLMQIVDSVQNLGASLGNWVRNTELRMKGMTVTSQHVFAPNQDPFLLSRMQARSVEFDTVDKKVRAGYISKDDGARELGYPAAFKE